ncbi:hypothetical protein MTR67_008224 [Solanum verrucosum]|uniref:Uncharacterized protein n=1 Tax=Solanum verrucosum TaxID=315347 RepID=A0AAF0Q7K5_SOLVR|nr:hypothetical protein MTR67_008224 [Solanum verrucosum]
MEENRDNVPTQETTSNRNLRRLAASKPTNVPCTSTRREHIVNCLSTFELVAASKPTNLPGTSTRGEHIVSCLSTFELVSTSAASHVASKLPSTRTANKGMLLSTKIIKNNVLF